MSFGNNVYQIKNMGNVHSALGRRP